MSSANNTDLLQNDLHKYMQIISNESKDYTSDEKKKLVINIAATQEAKCALLPFDNKEKRLFNYGGDDLDVADRAK